MFLMAGLLFVLVGVTYFYWRAKIHIWKNMAKQATDIFDDKQFAKNYPKFAFWNVDPKTNAYFALLLGVGTVLLFYFSLAGPQLLFLFGIAALFMTIVRFSMATMTNEQLNKLYFGQLQISKKVVRIVLPILIVVYIISELATDTMLAAIDIWSLLAYWAILVSIVTMVIHFYGRFTLSRL